MCGISVVIEYGSGQPIINRVEAMHDRVAHRGPDGEGWLAVDDQWTAIRAPSADALRDAVGDHRLRLAAAFRWLQIQDRHRSSGQPMESASGQTWVLFNGEVYNHRDLRRELSSLGQAFRTHSDTEALLAAYEHWGLEMFAHLNGMWGAVIIDLPRRALTMSRDRFGIRPLFYRVDAERLALGSEAKQLVCVGAERARIDRNAVLSFLAGRRPECGDTYFSRVRAVPTASWATVPLDGACRANLLFHRYWSPADASARPVDGPPSIARASEELECLLQDAVALESEAAVPVGALLSGGLDSSVICALLTDVRRRAGDHSSLLSVTSDDARGALDERPYMRAMATALAGDHVTAVEAPLDASWVDASMNRVTWHQEEPVPGVALVAHYFAHEAAAARGLRVVLEGTGSDELFAGYPRHQFARITDHLRHRRWLRGVSEFVAAVRSDRVFGPWLLEAMRASVTRRLGRILPAGRPPWVTHQLPPLDRSSNGGGGRDRRASRLTQMSLADLTKGNVPAVLAVTDRNAMAHSIETRVPYLDHRIVEFALRLPDDFKTSGGSRKVVLRDVARRRLPLEVADRRARIGFGMPIGDWLRVPLRASLLESVHAPEVTRGDIFAPAEAQRFVTGFLEGEHDDVASIWRIYALVRWMRLYDAAV